MANFVLIMHFLFVLFIVGGLALIWTGYFFQWSWVRNFRFRIIHLAAMAVVTLETVAGITCPLTDLESWFRSGDDRYDQGFIAYWIHELMFYNAPGYVFGIIYIIFLGLIVLTYIVVKTVRVHHKSTL